METLKIDDTYKKMLSSLPEKEKDKLLFRLIKKDKVLANQLYFQFIEKDSTEMKREKTAQVIVDFIDNKAKRFHSPGYLLLELRHVSSLISDHVKITKDKYGEVSLQLLMLRRTLEQNRENLLNCKYGASYTLIIYLVARTFRTLCQLVALHEDMHSDFKEDLEIIGKLIFDQPNIMKVAIYNQLDVNWLINCEIPKNIIEKQKELKAMGFLK